jgi:hypothetical protein
MPTRLSTLEHSEPIAHHATLLQIGIRQNSIYHIRNLSTEVKVEVVLITAGLPAANAIQSQYFRQSVPLAMIVIILAGVINLTKLR